MYFFSKKKELQIEIEKLPNIDPSEEIHNIWGKAKDCDPLTGIIYSKLKEDPTNENVKN